MVGATPFYYVNAPLATALRSMASLRKLVLFIGGSSDILDGCTFKLEVLCGDFIHSESLRKFLNSPPSLTNVETTPWLTQLGSDMLAQCHSGSIFSGSDDRVHLPRERVVSGNYSIS